MSDTKDPVRDGGAPVKATMKDYVGMGTLIGLGAALGLLVATMLGSSAIGMGLAAGAAAGTVVGAVVESRRARADGADR